MTRLEWQQEVVNVAAAVVVVVAAATATGVLSILKVSFHGQGDACAQEKEMHKF